MNTSRPLVGARRRTGPHGLFGFLSRLPGFDGRHEDAIDALAHICTPVSMERGETLWRVGDAEGDIGILRSGVVLLRRDLADHTVTLDVVGRGTFIGLPGGPRDHSAVVHEDGTLLRIRRADLERWLADHPDAALALLQVLGAVGQRMASRLALVSMHGARARLAMLLLDLSQRFGVRDSRGTIVDVRLTHREMASLIGATRETVSVAIVELRKQGIIRTEARRVIVVDESELGRVAGIEVAAAS